MKSGIPLSTAEFESVRELDTCTASNAIERLNVRLRNEGFISHPVCCRFPALPAMLGYAATARIRTSSPPMAGRCYFDRMDWWNYLAALPRPRVMVLQDCDPTPGVGAMVGEIHANIARALHCNGCVTNGAVRDLEALQSLGFHVFSGNVAVSHAYAHIIEFGHPVEIGGLKIHSGDLLHGDRNGVHLIPLDVAREVPRIAEEVLREEGELIRYCQSGEFSLEGLARRLQGLSHNGIPWSSPAIKPPAIKP